MSYVHKTSVTCLASYSASKTDAEIHSKANQTPFYLRKGSQENTSPFLRALGNHFDWENTASLHQDSAPKPSSTHLSFIPVCCLVHRHCWVNRCQLIGVRLHTDAAVEPQGQQVVHNLEQRNRQHLWISLHYTPAKQSHARTISNILYEQDHSALQSWPLKDTPTTEVPIALVLRSVTKVMWLRKHDWRRRAEVKRDTKS